MMFKKSLVTVGALGLLTFAVGTGCSSSTTPMEAGVDMDANMMMVPDSGRDVRSDRTMNDGGGGSMCPTPTDVSMFMPPTLPAPLGKYLNKCTSMQLQTYHDCVLNQNMTACNTVQMAAMTTFKDCLQCLEGSKTTDAQWGPLVCVDSMSCYLNVEGCVNLATNQMGAMSCGQLLHASYSCQRAACEEQCAGDSTGFSKCVQTAIAQGCKKYADAFSQKCGMLSSSDASDAGYPELDNCFRRNNEMDQKGVRSRMDNFFCGQ